MIVPEVDIHDKFSVEFKIGFIPDNTTVDINEFKINTWIFFPNSLDINGTTYNKEQFYKDIRNNIRLITPIYSLTQILEEGRGPLPRLHKAVQTLLDDPQSIEKTEDYAYQIKMLSCIVKSAIRTNVSLLSKETDEERIFQHVTQFADNVKLISDKYRELYPILKESVSPKQFDYFLFGDEFLGNVIEQHTFRIMVMLKNNPIFEKVKPILNQLLAEQNNHKQKVGFQIPVEGNEEHNKLVIIKRNLLKKFVESDLYLQTVTKKDGAFAEQIFYSIAAGVAMIFATVIAFFATQQFGNFTTDLFIVLVFSYMIKDRIKEMMRYYFSSHMSRKYFDNKRKLNIRKQEIGWIKESFDFVPESKVPAEVLNLRNRTPLVETENETYDEKIILYRKLVHLSRSDIEKYKQYRLQGVNDIMRLNLFSFILKMDNPTIPLYLPDEEEGYKKTTGHKEYPLYFILACESNEEVYYKKFRLLFNRNGISDVSELD